MTGRAVPLADRFWDKADVGAPDECWPWKASKIQKEYGHISVRQGGISRMPLAHRVAYELTVGPIPDGLLVLHRCDNPPCVNPAHLEPVTNAENQRRGLRANLTHCPQGHPYAGDNLYVTRRGGRKCRACVNAYHRELRARQRAAA